MAGAEPSHLGPGEGPSVENPTGGRLTFKATGSGTGGAMTVVEATAAPGEGPPLHVHREQDETIFVLDGRYRVRLAGRDVDAPAGAFVFIPRGTPHTWQNAGPDLARFVATLAPADARFERFFLRYAELPPEERDAEAFARIARETRGMEVVGPPLVATPRPPRSSSVPSAAYAHLNLRDLPDAAPGAGIADGQEYRPATEALGARHTGMAHQLYKPRTRQTWAHRHRQAEEIFVVLSGSGRVKLDDDVVELRPLDAIRVAPEVMRCWEGGPDGLEVLAFGNHEHEDWVIEDGWWT